jgi:glycosyltransferase 2 family protein
MKKDSRSSKDRLVGRRQPSDQRSRRWMSLVAVAVVALVAFLLYRALSRYSLEDIVASVSAIPLSRLMKAGGFAAASYLCLTGFDWLALHYVGKPLAYPKAALASFTSLSLGHNIGLAALSSGALRYRFYSRWGLGVGDVAKLILFCALTVAIGLTILGGAALLMRAETAEQMTGLRREVILGLGAACLLLAAGYLLLAAFARLPLRIRSWSLELPPLRLALAQTVIGPLNFAFVAACLHQVLAAAADIDYPSVASVYVIANTTAIVSHVPGGLGVIESVVIFLLPKANLIGALIAFRFVYFLVPLALGSTLLALTELTYRWSASAKDRQAIREAQV